MVKQNCLPNITPTNGVLLGISLSLIWISNAMQRETLATSQCWVMVGDLVFCFHNRTKTLTAYHKYKIVLRHNSWAGSGTYQIQNSMLALWTCLTNTYACTLALEKQWDVHVVFLQTKITQDLTALMSTIIKWMLQLCESLSITSVTMTNNWHFLVIRKYILRVKRSFLVHTLNPTTPPSPLGSASCWDPMLKAPEPK